MGIHQNVHAGTNGNIPKRARRNHYFVAGNPREDDTGNKNGTAIAHPKKTPLLNRGPCRFRRNKFLSTEATTLFRSTTGSLLHLSRCTRPDNVHAVTVLTGSMSTPGPRAMTEMTRGLEHLRGTISIGPTYSELAQNGDNSLHTVTQTTLVIWTRDVLPQEGVVYSWQERL